jgi:phosphoglycerate kinase
MALASCRLGNLALGAPLRRSGVALRGDFFPLSSHLRRRPFSGGATGNKKKKKSLAQLAEEIPLRGQPVLVRVDLNVPLKGQDITDETRVRAVLPTVQFLREKGAKVILASHLGRPKGKVVEEMRLTPVAHCLSGHLGAPIRTSDDCVGPAAEAAAAALGDGEVLLLENVRFHKAEEKNESEFAKKLGALANIYVNDAFGTAHRAHASTEGVTKYTKHNVAGFLLEKELQYLKGAVDEPKRPFMAVIGGSKVSTKIPVLESLLGKCDVLLLGGGMIFTFYKSRGMGVGSSIVEEDQLDLARHIEALAKERNVKLLLPTDLVIADKFAADAASKVVPADGVPDGWMGLDIGPESTEAFCAEMAKCKTVVWNGPMGVFEFDAFAKGTNALAKALGAQTKSGSTISIVGGGDCVAAVEKAGVADQISHISTGGGASLEMLEGKVLPGVAALDDA